MNDFYDYLIANFGSGVRLCKAPFASMVKEGDLVEVVGDYRKHTVLAVETASDTNNMLNLLTKINTNCPEGNAYKVSAIYSRKEIEWKEDEKND